MRLRVGPVVVKQFPETLTFKQSKIFFRELESCMTVDRPCIVLDCSKVRVMDDSTIHLMLCCLEEAMKRNGDVKLSAVSIEAREMLKFTGAERLFKVYDTAAEATNSFYHRPVHAQHAPMHIPVHEGSSQGSEIAA
jgi:anti-anti-sigma factor